MGQCREGLHALPKTMFDLFFTAVGAFVSGWWHFQRLGHFLRAGINHAPTGYAAPYITWISLQSPDYQCCYFVLTKNGEVVPGLCICLKKNVAKLCQCREGLHALPKTMFDIFLKAFVSFVMPPCPEAISKWLEIKIPALIPWLKDGRGDLSVLLRSPAHAAGQTEGRCDGGEDGDYHVDNHFPSFFFVIYRHKLLH